MLDLTLFSINLSSHLETKYAERPDYLRERRGPFFYFPEIFGNYEKLRLKVLAMNKMECIFHSHGCQIMC